MSFATPIPDMSNRAPRSKISRESRAKVGRPVNDDAYRIRTVAWFNAVAMGLNETRPGAIGKRMQEEADARSLDVNHSTSKRWYRYAKGSEGPEAQTLDFVNEVVPGTKEIFQEGPADLWTALWNDFSPRFHEDEVTALLSIPPAQINGTWLAKVVVCWRNRATIMRFGPFDDIVDGLYEAVFFGLGRQESVLSELGVWNLVREHITNSERLNLRADPYKRLEIIAAGGQNFGDPVKSYLSNPLEFAQILTKRTTPHDAHMCGDVLIRTSSALV